MTTPDVSRVLNELLDVIVEVRILILNPNGAHALGFTGVLEACGRGYELSRSADMSIHLKPFTALDVERVEVSTKAIVIWLRPQPAGKGVRVIE